MKGPCVVPDGGNSVCSKSDNPTNVGYMIFCRFVGL